MTSIPADWKQVQEGNAQEGYRDVPNTYLRPDGIIVYVPPTEIPGMPVIAVTDHST